MPSEDGGIIWPLTVRFPNWENAESIKKWRPGRSSDLSKSGTSLEVKPGQKADALSSPVRTVLPWRVLDIRCSTWDMAALGAQAWSRSAWGERLSAVVLALIYLLGHKLGTVHRLGNRGKKKKKDLTSHLAFQTKFFARQDWVSRVVKRKTVRKGLFVISKDGPRCYLLVWKALFGTPARASPGSLAASPLKARWVAGALGAILEGGK